MAISKVLRTLCILASLSAPLPVSAQQTAEPFANYVGSERLSALAAPVGRLDMLFADGTPGHCTAFHVGGNVIVTPQYCTELNDQELTMANFVIGLYSQETRDKATTIAIDLPVLEADEKVGYALLQLSQANDLDIPVAKVVKDRPADGDPIWLLAHPMGQPLHISRKDCRITQSPDVDKHSIYHVCSTQSGSGGGVLIDPLTQSVVGMHFAANAEEGFKIAVSSQTLLDNSPTLQALILSGTLSPVELSNDGED